jgi:YidC/Oxa1 family membrane protein insertase
MGIWSCFLELLQSGLFTATQLCGGNLGWGILLFSLTVRLAVLPLTYSLARRARARQLRVKKLAPAVERLRKRHQEDPARLIAETARLYRHHGVSPVDGRSILGAIIQLPFFAGMYTVIRRVLVSGPGGPFLWIANVSRADALLAVSVSGLTYAITLLNPSLSQQPQWLLIVSAVVPLLILLKLSAGLGIYWAASSAVSGVQSILVRRARIA